MSVLFMENYAYPVKPNLVTLGASRLGFKGGPWSDKGVMQHCSWVTGVDVKEDLEIEGV